MRASRFLVLAGVLAYGASGFYMVRPDEEAVVRRFGAASGGPRGPGPHLGLPWGLDRVDRVKPREVKQVAVGLAPFAAGRVPRPETQFLTGDRNLVNVEATVQYTVRDPVRYLFQSDDLDGIVARTGESLLAAALAAAPVDRVLTQGKGELAAQVAAEFQEACDAWDLGVSIRSLDLRALEPPPEVADAFDAAATALRERERAVHEAEAQASRRLAEARGEARQIADRAKAERERLVAEARGEAERFASLLVEYRKAPELTAMRLYLEALGEVLPRLSSKLIVDPGGGLDLSVFPGGDRGAGSGGPGEAASGREAGPR